MLGPFDKVTIPIKYENGFLTTQVVINKYLTLNFIVDTGAEVSFVFNPWTLEVLGLQPSQEVKVLGADLNEEMEAWIYRDVLLELPRTNSFKTDLMVLKDQDFLLDSYIGEQIDGILGAQVFRGMTLKINYLNQTLTLMKGDEFLKESNDYESQPIKILASKPYLTVKDNQDKDLIMLIDTGAAIDAMRYFESEEELPELVYEGQLGVGISGQIDGYIGIENDLRICNMDIPQLVVNYQTVDSIPDERLAFAKRDGILGNIFLSQFVVAIDYKTEKIYFKKNRRFREKARYNMTGMTIKAFGQGLNQYYVDSVIKGSPAAIAGIKRGDILVRINGSKYKFRTIESIYRLFSKKEDKTIKLKIIRNGQILKKQFQLKRYLN